MIVSVILGVGEIAILVILFFLHRKVQTLMATVAEFDIHLQSIETGVLELAQIVKDLKENGLVSQAQLDAFDAKAVKVLADIAAAK
jgi:hypothetical protein